MSQYNLWGITFRQVEIFLAAAKHENFTRAADDLHMTQASVSRNISGIEHELGLLLFVRHKRRVRLTQAGKSLVKEWASLSKMIEKSVEDAFVQQENQFRRLVICDNNMPNSEIYLIPLVEKFEEENPDVRLIVERENLLDEMKNLVDRKYDAIFISSVYARTLKKLGVEYVQIMELNPCLVLSKKHELYFDKEIEIEKLSRSPVIMLDDTYSDYRDFVIKVSKEIGYDFSSVTHVTNDQTIALEIHRGTSVAILDRTFTPNDSQDLRYLELDRCKTKSGILVAYLPDNTNPYLSEFVSLCKAPLVKKGFS